MSPTPWVECGAIGIGVDPKIWAHVSAVVSPAVEGEDPEMGEPAFLCGPRDPSFAGTGCRDPFIEFQGRTRIYPIDMTFRPYNPILIKILLCGSVSASPRVVINEVLSNAPGRESGSGSPGDRMEFVEVYNPPGQGTVDIGGWSISDGDAVDYIEAWEGGATDTLGGSTVIAGTTRLAPGRFALVLDPEYFDGGEGGWFVIGENTLVVTVGNTTLGDGLSATDPVVLCDADGDTVSTFGTPGWDDGFPADAGDGVSWERIDPAGDDRQENWTTCRDEAGSTPGARNSLSLPVNLSFVENSLVPDPLNAVEGGRVDLTAILWNKGISEASPVEIDLFMDRDGDGEVAEDEIVGQAAPIGPLAPGDSSAVSGAITAGNSGYYRVGMRAPHPDDGDTTDNVVVGEIRVGDPPPRIVLNEIFYDPPPGGVEWVEIYNRTPERLDLSGWKFSDNRTAGDLAGDPLLLEGGAYAVLSGDSSGLAEAMPGLAGRKIIEVSPFPSLSNRADTLRLATGSGDVSDRVEYLARWGGGNGVSLERVDPLDRTSGPSNWGSSVDPDGSTPGERNSICQESVGEGASLHVTPEVFSPDNDGHDDRTIIGYRLPVPRARVKVEVYDVWGRRVAVILDQVESGSEGQVAWDGRDDRGATLPIGMYVVYIEAIDPFSRYLLREKRAVVLAGPL